MICRVTNHRYAVLRAAAVLASSLLLASCATSSDGSDSADAGAINRLEIWTVYPAGSGNHQTATVIQEALETEGLVEDVEIVVHEGGNGTTGISDLVTQSPKNTILVAGFGEVGATIIGQTERTLEDTAPVARLMGEIGAIVVPADSKYQTLDDLLADIKTDPASVPIAVGNRGGVDDIFVANLAKEAGADVTKLNRVVFSGGGELMVALLGGQVAAGSSGYGEVIDQVEAGELRILALSSAEPLESDPTAPTLDSLGYPDAATMNWRGVYAGPRNSPEETQAIIDLITQMVQTDTWKKLAEQNGWVDNFIAGEEFQEFLKSEYTRTSDILRELGMA